MTQRFAIALYKCTIVRMYDVLVLLFSLRISNNHITICKTLSNILKVQIYKVYYLFNVLFLVTFIIFGSSSVTPFDYHLQVVPQINQLHNFHSCDGKRSSIWHWGSPCTLQVRSHYAPPGVELQRRQRFSL